MHRYSYCHVGLSGFSPLKSLRTPHDLLAKMHFSILALVSLPFLADALENGLPIPISKRSALQGADGRVDITKVQASRHHAIEFVSTILFKEKVGTH